MALGLGQADPALLRPRHLYTSSRMANSPSDLTWLLWCVREGATHSRVSCQSARLHWNRRARYSVGRYYATSFHRFHVNSSSHCLHPVSIDVQET